MDVCEMCEEPMKPGQRRAETESGGKAHSSCVALADGRVGLHELKKVWELDDAEARALFREVVAAIVDDRMADAVAKATVEAIPSRADDLRGLMAHAADHLDSGIDSVAKGSHPNLTALVAMTKAAAVLRTVAIYLRDEVAAR